MGGPDASPCHSETSKLAPCHQQRHLNSGRRPGHCRTPRLELRLKCDCGCMCVCLLAMQVCSSMFGANAADSLGSVLCGAVQLELFLAQQQAPPNSPAQAMAAAQDRVSCV